MVKDHARECFECAAMPHDHCARLSSINFALLCLQSEKNKHRSVDFNWNYESNRIVFETYIEFDYQIVQLQSIYVFLVSFNCDIRMPVFGQLNLFSPWVCFCFSIVLSMNTERQTHIRSIQCLFVYRENKTLFLEKKKQRNISVFSISSVKTTSAAMRTETISMKSCWIVY